MPDFRTTIVSVNGVAPNESSDAIGYRTKQEAAADAPNIASDSVEVGDEFIVEVRGHEGPPEKFKVTIEKRAIALPIYVLPESLQPKGPKQ
jgi:hypothetical protein